MRSRINQVVAVNVAAAMALFAQAPAQAPNPAREPGLYATMTTSRGAIVLRLYEAESPVTVRNFVDLALGRKPWRDPKSGQTVERPLYGGLTFHRIMKGFMILKRAVHLVLEQGNGYHCST